MPSASDHYKGSVTEPEMDERTKVATGYGFRWGEAEQAKQAQRPPTPAAETVVVILGSGTGAPDGVARFREWSVASLAIDGGVHPDVKIGFAAAARPEIEWMPASRLGADQRLAKALVAQATEAAIVAFGRDAAFSREKNLSPEAG